jgi:hypothetical protein
MKTIAIILALIFIGIAIVYFVVPANSLPSFFPGFDPSLPRTHIKHGIASFALGVVLFVVAWMLGRR